MASLNLVAAAVLAGSSLELWVTGCDAAIDAITLRRLILLEWPEPPPGTKAVITCDPTHWTLALEAPDLVGAIDRYELPALAGAARTRVLALIVSERGRAFTNAPASAPPPPEAPPPLVESVRAPVMPRVEPTTPRVEPASAPLREGLVSIGGTPSNTWRLSAGIVALTPFTNGPWRFGPELRVQAGTFTLALGATIGKKATELGEITAYAVTAEPELTVACLGGGSWRACIAARGIIGYGAISATTKLAEIETKRVDNAVLGGAAVFAASVRLADWLALEGDVRAGGAWGVVGSQGGEPIAAIGGGLAAGSLSLVASWGRP